jgi:type II secretory pathway pseudopilin PulG
MKKDFTYNRKGTTLIELSFVTGIAALLLAMILGLAQHVTRISNISKAKTVLGAWHQAMDNWHQAFGEYPGDIYEGGTLIGSPYNDSEVLGRLSNTYYQVSIILYSNNTMGGVDFRNYATQPVKIFDPWGTPYIYERDESKQAYQLYSCGPDASSPVLGDEDRTGYDDIYFDR